jgi:hypothetical protein
MEELAVSEHLDFARAWIVRNAQAALSARATDGTFARFFDGPPQPANSIWESNGGFALEIAAAEIEPNGVSAPSAGWQQGQSLGQTLTQLPATISFEGSGIALIGTIAEPCAKAHLRVFVDGVETFDRTGLWQNHDMPGREAVRFAWRWPAPGKHSIRIEPSWSPETTPAFTGDLIRLDGIVLPSENVGSR